MGMEQDLKRRNQEENGCTSPDHAQENSAQGCTGHHHGPALQDTSGTRLLITLVLNLIIPTAQIAGGLLAGSVALIYDALHNVIFILKNGWACSRNPPPC